MKMYPTIKTCALNDEAEKKIKNDPHYKNFIDDWKTMMPQLDKGEDDEVESTNEEEVAATSEFAKSDNIAMTRPTVNKGILRRSNRTIIVDPIDAIIKTIQKGKCRKIITVGGAGMSTSAGIPDIRSEGIGKYKELEKYNIDFPEEALDIDMYKKNPRPFLIVAKDFFPGYHRPTLCHYFITLLAEKGFLLRHYTQNVDSLERIAGLSGEYMVQAHGSFSSSRCVKCTKEYPPWWFKQHVLDVIVPKCLMCTNLVRPNIIFWGENLSKEFYKRCASDLRRATFLLAIGTSFKVQPFASLIRKTRQGCTRLLIKNSELESHDVLKVDTIKDVKNGPIFNPSKVIKDVMWQMDCDEGCWQLADRLGWGMELLQMMEENNKKVDEKIKKTKKDDEDPIFYKSYGTEKTKEEKPNRALKYRIRLD